MFYKKVVYCLVAHHINQVYSYEKLENIDFYGGDLYPVYNINESISCMKLCERVRDCVAVTHCDDVCYIKDKKMEGVMKEGCITFDMYPENKIWSSTWGSSMGSSMGSNIGSIMGSNDEVISDEDIILPEITTPVSSNDSMPIETIPAVTETSNAGKPLIACTVITLLSIQLIFL